MLILPIKKKWFDMILSGEKKEEYRELKPYYKSRFAKIFEMHPYSYIPTGLNIHEIIFRNGYRSDSPSLIARCSLDIKQGKSEWGAEEGKEYYVLKIYSIDLFLPKPGKDCKNCIYKECKKLEEINIGNMTAKDLRLFQENELYKKRIQCITKRESEV